MSGRSDIDRITAFANRFARSQATDVVDLPWGFAVLNTEFPVSHEHNQLIVTAPAPAGEVLATAETVLGEAGLQHRYVSVNANELGHALSIDFLAAGYEHERIATMIYARRDIDLPAHPVQSVSPASLRPALIRDWRLMVPDASDEELSELADRTALYDRAAEVTRLAVFAGDEIAAHADLYIDRAARIAQIENVVTHPDFRERGYGRALVLDALQRGREVGAEISCLTAGLDDWPYGWYRRLGYIDAGRSHHCSTPD